MEGSRGGAAPASLMYSWREDEASETMPGTFDRFGTVNNTPPPLQTSDWDHVLGVQS